LVTRSEDESEAMLRLKAVAGTLDGFALSKIDLEQRREGDVLGASQSGRRSQLRLLRVLEDEELIIKARQIATSLLEKDPSLATVPLLAKAIAEREAESVASFVEKG
jgi:ATP-dependent DNA helicase RecG